MTTVILDASSMSEKEKINQWIFHACSSNDMPGLYNDISWSFDNRLTNCMGKAFCSQKLIKLSNRLWPSASEQERKNTTIHEAIHIIAREKYGWSIKSHGREWKWCMLLAGEVPSRCHDVQIIRRKVKRYVFKCGQGHEYNLTTSKYNRSMRYNTSWYCPKCPHGNNELYFTGKIIVRE